MLKKSLVCGTAVALLGLVGCFDNPLDVDESTVSIPSLLASVTAPAGQFTAITGEVEASETPSISYVITDKDNAVSTDIAYDVSAPTKKNFSFTELDLKVKPAASACNGPYKLTITVSVGTSASATKSTVITVSGATCGSVGTPVALGSELVLGSNGNSTLGSSIDIDAGMVYLSAAAKTNSNKVDLCYAYSGTANTDKIGTPSWANASGYAFANGWTTYNPTKFYKLVSGITNTTAISSTYATREVLEAAFDVSKAVESDNAVKGDVFIVKTDMDVIALLWVKDQVVGTTGTITVITAK